MCCVFCDELLVVLRVFNASWSIVWSRSSCVSSSTQQHPAGSTQPPVMVGAVLWAPVGLSLWYLLCCCYQQTRSLHRLRAARYSAWRWFCLGCVFRAGAARACLSLTHWAENNRCSTEVISTIKTKCYMAMKHNLHLIIKLYCITVNINNAWILITNSQLPAGEQHVFLPESKNVLPS